MIIAKVNITFEESQILKNENNKNHKNEKTK